MKFVKKILILIKTVFCVIFLNRSEVDPYVFNSRAVREVFPERNDGK